MDALSGIFITACVYLENFRIFLKNVFGNYSKIFQLFKRYHDRLLKEIKRYNYNNLFL